LLKKEEFKGRPIIKRWLINKPGKNINFYRQNSVLKVKAFYPLLKETGHGIQQVL
jgi:hypothetical protein